MSQTEDKLKPKFLIAANKQTKLTVKIPQKLSDLIADYQLFHKEVAGDEVNLDSLVSAFVSAALTSDKSFVKWRKEKNEKQTLQDNSSQS